MRVNGWMIALGGIALIGATVVCSFAAYGLTRNFAIEAGEIADLPRPDALVSNIRPTQRSAPTVVPEDPTATPDTEDTSAVAVETAVAPVEVAAVPVVGDASEDILVNQALGEIGPRKKTILLMGIDQRSAVESSDTEFFRTDTMIVVQIDPVRRTAGMLSIPRDLWVDIPNFQPGRINTANYLGDANALPGGGPGLAMDTVRENLGLDVDNYMLVNFDVFTTVVDTIAPNGVEVCVQELIDDPDYPDTGYGTIAIRFEPGCQRMNSEQLLQYARTRATQGADFDRARRQQQVITAVQSEVVSAGGIRNLVLQAPALWEQLSANLQTDLTFEEALNLALVASTIDREDIQQGVIDNLYVELAKNEAGDDILIPRPSAISALIQQTFNVQGDLTVDDLRELAAAEEASIVVLNNTTTIGLADTTRTWLADQGVAITTIGNTQNPNNNNTIIRDYTGNPWTAQYLAAVMGLSRDQVLSGSDGATGEDVAVIIGPDITQITGP